jgi:uncharacterized membrane protein YdjX (TVP38/TMEM64 family)
VKLNLRLATVVLGVAAMIAAIKYLSLQERLGTLLRWIDSLGNWGPAAFILIYIAGCVLFVPGSALTLGAGILFGVPRGSIIVSIAATLGATAAFLIARYLAREWVAGKLAAHPKFSAVDQAVASEGWKMVGLIRLSPIFPFSLMNYAFGITRVSLRDYVLASWIGMLPGTVMYVYIGSLIGDLGNLGSTNRQKTLLEWTLYAVGLLATIVITFYVTRTARKALGERIRA